MINRNDDMHRDGERDAQKRAEELDNKGLCLKCGEKEQEEGEDLCSECMEDL